MKTITSVVLSSEDFVKFSGNGDLAYSLVGDRYDWESYSLGCVVGEVGKFEGEGTIRASRIVDGDRVYFEVESED